MLDAVEDASVLIFASSRACVWPKLRVSDLLRSGADIVSGSATSPGFQPSRACWRVARTDAVVSAP